MSEQIKFNHDGFNVIGDVFNTLRFNGSIFFTSGLAAPWGMSLEEIAFPRFHISLSGNFCLSLNNQDVIHIQNKEIILLTDGNAHWIADQPGRELIPSEKAGKTCQLGQPLFQQGKITNRIICGLIRYDRELSHPIFDALPAVLHFPRLESDEAIWLSVNLMGIEMDRNGDHSNPIIDRIAEVLFLQLLNRYVSENKEIVGFFAALKNRQIHQVLRLIHQYPNFEWSLSSLSQHAGMSRATLVRHFQDTLGMAPMAYLMNWRIQKAYSLIKYSNISLEKIAESVGFKSARTLSKTFQRCHRCTPSELRKHKMQPAEKRE